MRFLVDECTGPAVARWLRDQKHEVFSVYDDARGACDDDLLEKAYQPARKATIDQISPCCVFDVFREVAKEKMRRGRGASRKRQDEGDLPVGQKG